MISKKVKHKHIIIIQKGPVITMNKTMRTRLVAMLLAAVMAVGLAACGSQSAGSPGAPGIADTGELPEVNALPGIPRGNGDTSSGSGIPRGNKNKLDPETVLKQYGEIETVTKSIKSPSKPDTKNTKMDNGYGTVDWSTAANGYITFTAKGQTRVFILQGPDDTQALFDVNKGDMIKIALVDGTGKYQYAIANITNGGKSYRVQYKNSFTVKSIDAELAPYLVSTPYGDYENAPNATAKAKELWDSKKTQLENIEAIAEWVGDLKYDKALKQGTVGVYIAPDSVIENGGGVCNEMTKLLSAMLRSQGVPAYVQTGHNARGNNHGWVMAWVELSTSVKDGVTSSKGAWVLIEAVQGDIQLKGSAERNYSIPEDLNYAN